MVEGKIVVTNSHCNFFSVKISDNVVKKKLEQIQYKTMFLGN